MRRSQLFCPVYKEAPKDAQITSHQLMLRAGMIEQASSGIYSWLPLGLRVLKNIEQIIREEHEREHINEVLLPTVQSADLWRQSGRYDAYGDEMLRIADRHGRDMLYTPTAEELVTAIAAHHIKSYKDLPQLWYQIQWKFRDERRPRFGVMRGREFSMKDAYSMDIDEAAARASYKKMMRVYVRIFNRLGLAAVPVRAETGPIGGDLSHEFHIVAQTGESALYYEEKLEDLMEQVQDPGVVDALMNVYAAADDLHDPSNVPEDCGPIKQARGIEVGHVFYFGEKYARALDFKVAGPDNRMLYPHMGSYGIGVSRLVGAIIEASHDDKGILWPKNVTPYHVGLINVSPDDAAATKLADRLYAMLRRAGVSTLYDDRALRPGVKYTEQELLGLPLQVRCGKTNAANGLLEVVARKTGARQELSPEDVVAFVHSYYALKASDTGNCNEQVE